MKRSKELIPLSWEHHSALVNASRIQRGLENQTAVSILQEFIEFIWQHDLRPHFDREENIIINRTEAEAIDPGIKQRTLDEHREFNDLFDRIVKSNNSEQKMSYMERFAKLLTDHVRFEENQFFPAVEEHFTADILQLVGKQLKEQHVPACITWNPPFWEKPRKDISS